MVTQEDQLASDRHARRIAVFQLTDAEIDLVRQCPSGKSLSHWNRL
jgi:hypothetical protein